MEGTKSPNHQWVIETKDINEGNISTSLNLGKDDPTLVETYIRSNPYINSTSLTSLMKVINSFDISKRTKNGKSMLQVYVGNNKVTEEGLNAILENSSGYKFDINEKSIESGSTLLHIYARDNKTFNEEGVNELISIGLDVKSKDKFGLTALHVHCRDAFVGEEGGGVKALISAGLSAKEVDSDGYTALHLYTALNQYITAEGLSLLMSLGLDINLRDANARTPLYNFCGFSPVFNDSNLAILIKAGADPTIVDYNGRTCFHAYTRDAEIDESGIDALLALKLISTSDKDKRTELHYYIENSSCNIQGIELLLAKTKVNKYAVDSMGNTAYSLAQKKSLSPEICSLLKPPAGLLTPTITKKSVSLSVSSNSSRTNKTRGRSSSRPKSRRKSRSRSRGRSADRGDVARKSGRRTKRK